MATMRAHVQTAKEPAADEPQKQRRDTHTQLREQAGAEDRCAEAHEEKRAAPDGGEEKKSGGTGDVHLAFPKLRTFRHAALLSLFILDGQRTRCGAAPENGERPGPVA